jgi:transcriptional regulator with XRE-family HTH domain
VGERLRARRLELGLSLEDLAEPGITIAHISRIERGLRQPSVRALRKLAAKLETSAAWLEFGQDDPARQLAELVLEHRAGLSRRALILARRVLRER